jgi:hypothetical protein
MADFHPDAAKARRAGPHKVTIEPPDLVYLHIDGNVELDHVKVFFDAINKFPASTKVHILRDARKSGIVTPDAREFVLKNYVAGKVVAFISFGAPFRVRTVITMIAKALSMLRRDSPVIGFTDTEAEARAWIDRIRCGARS